MPVVTLPSLTVLAATTFLLSLSLCAFIQRAARRLRLVDVPNERSLHQVPVPRLGGVAIVLGVGAALAIASRIMLLFAQSDIVACLAGASIIAVLGFADDIRHLPAFVRLIVQLAVTGIVLAVVLHGHEVNIVAGLSLRVSPSVALPLALVFVVGTLNIYNFMDGMDGLAAMQTMSASVALAGAAAAASQPDVAIVASLICAASAGFFVHNAPPATLFLGDAGSTFLGFTFGVLTFVSATRASPVPVGVLPLALAPFLLDGTFTIFRRLTRGERIWRAHKSHLYQRAVATGLSHRQVLVVYAAWSAVAAIGSVLSSQLGPSGTIAVWLGMLVPLAAVWGWVVRREKSATRSGAPKTVSTRSDEPLPP